jgi:hypothetical protein
MSANSRPGNPDIIELKLSEGCLEKVQRDVYQLSETLMREVETRKKDASYDGSQPIVYDHISVDVWRTTLLLVREEVAERKNNRWRALSSEQRKSVERTACFFDFKLFPLPPTTGAVEWSTLDAPWNDGSPPTGGKCVEVPAAADAYWHYEDSTSCFVVKVALLCDRFQELTTAARTSCTPGNIRVILNLEHVDELTVTSLDHLLNCFTSALSRDQFKALELQHARLMTATTLAFVFRKLKCTAVEELYLFRDEINPCVVHTNQSNEIQQILEDYGSLLSRGSLAFGACLLSDAGCTWLTCMVCPHEGVHYQKLLQVLTASEHSIERIRLRHCGIDKGKLDDLLEVLATPNVRLLQALNLMDNLFDGEAFVKLLEWVSSTVVNELNVRRVQLPLSSLMECMYEYDPDECEHFQFDVCPRVREAARNACCINPLLLCDAFPPAWREQLPVPVFPEGADLRKWVIAMKGRPLTDFALVEINQTHDDQRVFFRVVPKVSTSDGDIQPISIFLKHLKKLRESPHGKELFDASHQHSRYSNPCLLFRNTLVGVVYNSLMDSKYHVAVDDVGGIISITDSSLGSEPFAMLLDGYFDFTWEAALPSSPLRAAAACLALLDTFPHLSYTKLIGTNYFGGLQKKTNSTVREDDLLAKRLEQLFDEADQSHKYRRNSAVADMLKAASVEGLVVRDGEPYFVHAACRALNAFVWRTLRETGLDVKKGPPKKPYRLRQKYEEYAHDYLKPTWALVLHVQRLVSRHGGAERS